MDVFDLFAKLSLDTSEYESGLNDARGSAEKGGSSIGAALRKAGKVAAAGIAAASAAVVALGKQSINTYADYEQLVGGVETLFGDSAKKVISDADQAFKSAGMSANDYMETSIQSAAAMINSLGGDQAKAADLMNMSITDMADNVNKMGTSMEAVQNAYRGFSRGNFTMLDNLALGFAGTKEGMQNLLDKAHELSGVEFNIDSYSDIVEAIHVVQTEMGITGTTAKEAGDTISGSVHAMKSAWKNLLGGLANESADLGKLIDNLIESIIGKNGKGGVINNILPAVERALNGIAKVVTTAAPKIVPIIVKIILDNLPTIINAGTQVLVALITGIIQALQQLIAAIPQILAAIVGAFQENWPVLKEAGIQILYVIGEGILSAVGWLLEKLGQLVAAIKDYLTQKWTEIKEDTEELWKRMVNNVTDRIQKFKKKIIDTWEAIKTSVTNAVENIKNTVTSKAKSIKDTVTNTWNNLKNAVKNANSGMQNILTSAWGNLKSAASSHFNGIKTTISTIMKNVKSSISSIWSGIYSNFTSRLSTLGTAVYKAFSNIWENIKNTMTNIRNLFSGITFNFPHIKLPHFSWDWIDLGGLVSIPRIYIDWYKRAYENPVMFTSPTVLGTASGLKGFGDGQGGEMVYGHDNLMRDISNAVSGAIPNVIINVYPQKGQSEAEIAKQVQKEFVRWDKQRKAAAFA